MGRELGIPGWNDWQASFSGPGLAIRILGEVTEEKVQWLEADHLYIKALKDNNLYATVWQVGAILLPVKSVGVMGDERTYEYTACTEGRNKVWMEWQPTGAHLPYDFLANVEWDH